jgi:hypothetical protein
MNLGGASRFFITALAGPLTGREFVIVGGEVRVGRTPENDIVVEDRNISRHHASLWVEKGALWIQDAGSKNGVFVNNEHTTNRKLEHGDIVRLGPCEFRVGIEQTDEALPPLEKVSGQLARLKALAERFGYKRIALYGTGLCILVYLFSMYSGSTPPGVVLSGAPLPPQPIREMPIQPVRATPEEVTLWQRQAELALRYDDMPAAIPLLRKIVAAKPHDPLPRAQLARAQQHLSQLIQRYLESGVREYQKMYYDRAVAEWQKVLALSEGFDPETYRETQAKLREAREKLNDKR